VILPAIFHYYLYKFIEINVEFHYCIEIHMMYCKITVKNRTASMQKHPYFSSVARCLPLPSRCHVRTENSPIHGRPRATLPCGLRDRIPLS